MSDLDMKKFKRWNMMASIILLLVVVLAVVWSQLPESALDRLHGSMTIVCFFPAYCALVVVVLFNNPHWKHPKSKE
jgi:lysylphosphatidylglycerol synthetase-like protein (DUF2156 family)